MEGETAVELARLQVDAFGVIVAAQVADDPRARGLRRLRPGVELAATLERIDGASAGRIGDALAGGRAASGRVALQAGDEWLPVRYAVAPLAGGAGHDLALSLDAADGHLLRDYHDLQASGLALARVTSLLNRDMAAGDIARAVLPDIVATVRADTGALLRVRGDGRAEVLAAFGPTRRRSFPYPVLEVGAGIAAEASQRPGLVTVTGPDLAHLPSALRDLSPRAVGSVVLAPAFAGHRLRGLLALGARRSAPLAGHEADFLRAVADATGLALDHVVMSRQSELSEVVLDTACAVARAISGSLELEHTFQQIASSAARVMGNCRCLLLELQPDDDDLSVVACSGPEDDPLLGVALRFEGRESTREALLDGRSIVIEDIAWGAHIDAAARERLHLRSALFVPIRADNDLIGSLLLYSSERRDSYSARDVARAEIVAEQAASAICNARLYRDLERSQQRSRRLLRRLTSLRQEKRKEWATVLHDDIVQTMVAALYQVQGMEAELPAETATDAERISGLLRTAIGDTRRVIRDLRPPALDGLGLRGALQSLAEQAEGGTCEVRLDLAAAPELSPAVETSLYVIAREALQNALRHSGARHVDLCLAAGGEVVRLTVRDDGRGLQPAAVERDDHFGLTMMDEQAALVGGELQIGAGPDGGTTVEVVVPQTTARAARTGVQS